MIGPLVREFALKLNSCSSKFLNFNALASALVQIINTTQIDRNDQTDNKFPIKYKNEWCVCVYFFLFK